MTRERSTGGGAVARIICKAAAEHLTPVCLELGGQCPVIVDDTCNLSIAAKRIVWAKTFNAGQVCVAPNHVFVLRSIADKFADEVKRALAVQFPDQGKADMGTIINSGHHQRITSLIDQTKGEIVCGNEREGLRLSPTVVKGVLKDDALMSQEIFGPVLPIVAVDSVDEAIGIINSGCAPFYLW